MKKRFLVSFLVILLVVFVSVAFADDPIPSVKGVWNVHGEGTWGDIFVRDDGVATIDTYVDVDGYEVIVEYSYAGTIRDGAGNVLMQDSYTLDRWNLDGGGIKVDSREATITAGPDVRFDITIISDTQIDAHRTGRAYDKPVVADYTLVQSAPAPGAGGGSGGGCNVSALSTLPSSLLLLFPLFSVLRKK